MTGLWAATLLVLGAGSAGWRAMPVSLLGWSWIGFGLAFVARFWVLSIDAVTFGDMSERLLAVPAGVVNEALVLAALYWAAVMLAYRSCRRRDSTRWPRWGAWCGPAPSAPTTRWPCWPWWPWC